MSRFDVSVAEWRHDLIDNPYWADKPTAVASMTTVLDELEALQSLVRRFQMTEDDGAIPLAYVKRRECYPTIDEFEALASARRAESPR